MAFNKTPIIRITILIFVVFMLVYLPTREFLKITFFIGIPFIFLLGFMKRQTKKSLKWNIAAVLIVGVVGVYGYMLTGLPDRITGHRVVMEGNALVAEGRFNAAIDKYSELEEIGQISSMERRIESVKKEQKAQENLEAGRTFIRQEKYAEAQEVLEQIPPRTRVSREAAKLLDIIN